VQGVNETGWQFTTGGVAKHLAALWDPRWRVVDKVQRFAAGRQDLREHGEDFLGHGVDHKMYVRMPCVVQNLQIGQQAIIEEQGHDIILHFLDSPLRAAGVARPLRRYSDHFLDACRASQAVLAVELLPGLFMLSRPLTKRGHTQQHVVHFGIGFDSRSQHGRGQFRDRRIIDRGLWPWHDARRFKLLLLLRIAQEWGKLGRIVGEHGVDGALHASSLRMTVAVRAQWATVATYDRKQAFEGTKRSAWDMLSEDTSDEDVQCRSGSVQQ
jgi:hypothetical protein